MKKILLIEDDTGILNSLKLYLENSNFEVSTWSTGENAVEKIQNESFDIIILDINLPEKSGIDICKEVRRESQVPIIMLTARNEEVDKVLGLEMGADDYISKPFSPRELLARINTILRRTTNTVTSSKTISNVINYEDISIDIDKFIVKKGDTEIFLTKSEYNILRRLVEEEGRVVSRETLMKEIIGYEQYIFDRTIDTHIKNIRKKLDDKQIIITVRGEGYRVR